VAVLTPKAIGYPFACRQIGALRAGDLVQVSGHVFACRDRVHKHLFEGGASPVDLKDGAIYHCGPAVLRKDDRWVIRAAGPTTSMRQEIYTPRIIEKHQVRVIIGKGGMGEGTRKACAAFGCVYLQAVGGAAQMLAGRVESVASVHFLEDFGPSEALWDFVVRDFPAIVAIDAAGRSLFRRVELSSRSNLRKILKATGPFRG
jgi:tartrate/fumarate subfamily iron-sulfur-dependent hydro-lyase beta chain